MNVIRYIQAGMSCIILVHYELSTYPHLPSELTFSDIFQHGCDFVPVRTNFCNAISFGLATKEVAFVPAVSAIMNAVLRAGYQYWGMFCVGVCACLCLVEGVVDREELPAGFLALVDNYESIRLAKFHHA